MPRRTLRTFLDVIQFGELGRRQFRPSRHTGIILILRGTHQAPFMNVRATGPRQNAKNTDVVRQFSHRFATNQASAAGIDRAFGEWVTMEEVMTMCLLAVFEDARKECWMPLTTPPSITLNPQSQSPYFVKLNRSDNPTPALLQGCAVPRLR
jgi:hypothetical protein